MMTTATATAMAAEGAAAGADGATEVCYQDRRYVIPTEDVIVLPINNTSAENLATWFARELRQRLARRFPDVALRRLAVGVEETPGQRGIFHLDCTNDRESSSS